MGKINVLSFEVANLIAAGEVVDRPSSVIKELVENSIDSGADRITVEIQHGGVTFMRVTDNGCGIVPEDLAVAVRRHATSKIKNADDLDAIITLGFRGEALAAIGAVSDLRIISKIRENQLGAAIEVNSGRIGSVTERGASDGTTVIVENLFANVPARLKFLKRDITEAMAVCSVVEKIAMSHPEIAFKLISDGSVKLETVGDGKLASAVRCIYGKDFVGRMIAAEGEMNGVRVYGYITSPVAPRANRNYQNFFINGRYIKTKTGSAAIEQAYTSYIPPEKFPGCVLCIEIAPSVVDVNVHPSKLEVKFSNERPVFDCIYNAVRTALLQNSERPDAAGTDRREGETDKKTNPRSLNSIAVGGKVSAAYVPVSDRVVDGGRAVHQIGFSETSAAAKNDPDDFWQHISAGTVKTQIRPPVSDKTGEETKKTPTVPAVSVTADPAPFVDKKHVSLTQPERENVEDNDKRTTSSDIDPDRYELAELIGNSGGDYRIVGEIFNSYVLVETGDQLIVIDKHAAHERIIFEELRRSMTPGNERTSQFLALPVEVILMSDEVAAIEQYREKIESIGFSFTTARNTVYVSEIPASVKTDEVTVMFENFAEVIKSGAGSVELTQEIVFEKALYQASCKAAIKAGRVYPEGYVKWLVEQLFRHPEVTYCPHGRPIALKLEKSYINHRFKRN